MPDSRNKKDGLIRRCFRPFLNFQTAYPILGLLVMFGAGVLFWGGFNTAMEMTNSTEFCISCHEMHDNAYRDYVTTFHFKNAAGVQAGCPDCHVPRDWKHMVIRKISATNELYHTLIGSIDTREKYLKRRSELAQTVWQEMKATDSRECRNCHNLTSMDLDKQKNKASKAHKNASKNGHTCIDCHKGVMHSLSEELRQVEHDIIEEEKIACSNCHTGLVSADDEDWGW